MTARGRCLFAALTMLIAAGGTAMAGGCPGNPDALGTSRTIVIDPAEHPRIGTMQYAETLPLEDHEVVLSFDDGPLPSHTLPILDILAAQCVKATFFMVGRMAHDFPAAARRVRDAGHTIGTHSENHPLRFGELPPERIAAEIDDGIAHVAEALGDRAAVAPFFRVPGLRRAENVEAELARRGIMTWSADFPADDWRHISSAQVLRLALSRLEAKGKGILLLHDIQARTQAALPELLRELKLRGYRIVHVVLATPERPKTVTDPRQWFLHPPAALRVANGAAIPFTFNARERPPLAGAPASVWLAHAPAASLGARLMSRLLEPDAFRPAELLAARMSHHAKRPLPGSWPVRAAEMKAGPAGGSTKAAAPRVVR